MRPLRGERTRGQAPSTRYGAPCFRADPATVGRFDSSRQLHTILRLTRRLFIALDKACHPNIGTVRSFQYPPFPFFILIFRECTIQDLCCACQCDRLHFMARLKPSQLFSTRSRSDRARRNYAIRPAHLDRDDNLSEIGRAVGLHSPTISHIVNVWESCDAQDKVHLAYRPSFLSEGTRSGAVNLRAGWEEGSGTGHRSGSA